MTDFQKQVIELVNSDYTVTEIAKALNRKTSSVCSVTKAYNLHPKKKFINTVRHDYFDVIDSDKKAYYLGYFIADGSVSKDGRFSINVSTDDEEIIKQLHQELTPPSEITYRNNQNDVKHRKIQVILRWTSKHMLESIKKFGLGTNKTLINFEFPFELIPNKYLGALIRGFIDGDGSFEQHDGIFNPSIVSPNEKWLDAICNIVCAHTGLVYKKYTHQGKTCVYYIARWSAHNMNKPEKIQKMYDFLYKGAEVFLHRKRVKIEAYLKYRANQVRVKGIWRCNA